MTKSERQERNQIIMDLYGDLNKPPKEIAEVVECSVKTVNLVINSNLTPEEREQRVLDHRAKVHLNFKRGKKCERPSSRL